MKNPYDVLRVKEQELIRVRKETDALRIVARLLESDVGGSATGTAGVSQAPLRTVEMP